ncbi:hypothetical protein LXL04_023866 [Taraxacum kok-saghyz]
MANSISSLIVLIDDSPSTVRDLKPVGPILNLPTVRVLRAAQSRLRQRLFVFMTPGESAIPTSNTPFLPWKALVKGDVFLPNVDLQKWEMVFMKMVMVNESQTMICERLFEVNFIGATGFSQRICHKDYDILKQAPFLVPFTSRVKLFTSQLAAIKERPGSHSLFNRSTFKIRRDHILEDAFSQLSTLPEEDLRGVIRVTFVNEFGVEEAGIDGGGIFKDFMENITRAAFDMQYGLFKETIDHLLYPNPGSGMIHEQHLQFFHFLGIILGKAMFEGILVDIPFATFFLSKLKQKHNYLNDLPSLDPELYRHLIFLKRFEGDLSELELYFVIVNNEYGEQTSEELIPGGKNIRVVNDNVITFIHLVANHRLNTQIRLQSSHF